LHRRLGGLYSKSWRDNEETNCVALGYGTRLVQPIATWCTPAHRGNCGSDYVYNNKKDGDDKDSSNWLHVSATADYYEVLYRNICY